MRRWMTVAAVLAVTGCGAAPADPIEEENATLKIRAELAVERQLKDPESARFETYVSRASGLPVVCGTVNAKNGFGGYTGAKLFLSAGDVVHIASDQNASQFRDAWTKLCGPKPG